MAELRSSPLQSQLRRRPASDFSDMIVAVSSSRDAIQIVRGACGHDCPDTCGWIVEVKEGAAERLYGDPAHPFTRGTLCAKVNHYLERVYHPDRVLHPLKRVGPKGEGRFARVSWDEALADIASRWRAIVEESGAEAILPYSSAGVQGLVQQESLDARLFARTRETEEACSRTPVEMRR